MRVDLVVLVADKDMEVAIRRLLQCRADSLKIRGNITFAVHTHPQRDPGVLNDGVNFLRNFVGKCSHALVLFDREGCGREHLSAERLEEEMEAQLHRNGWSRESVSVIVLDPELEIWVWSGSSHVSKVIGLSEQELDSLLKEVPCNALKKPLRPKEALKEALRRSTRPFSSSIFDSLAKDVSLTKCQDRAFKKFKATLRRWFPPQDLA
ncbi:hypothetical protein Spith_1263 [Spirochaeta thermophila DSM 6578]|uniref:DUF4276 family protein n=1 Tax=Winmispira thermophila (strain ATCC 700085 / DSM 6578 / Z-1203) TaxID=869211 RepID=G0GFB4_WINT7|nr:hypothetical protein [Spirochaeta thermophila]AEJ61528.1 hypothetical protein Spith_1263 [Spirochaeta thermophila DSM 6578]